MTKLGAEMELTKTFYSPHEVAQIAGVHSSTILNYIASGRLYAVKLSERTYRIPARSVLQLLAPDEVSSPTVTVETDNAVNLATDREIEEADLVTA